jgi:serine/threonine-protein kinase
MHENWESRIPGLEHRLQLFGVTVAISPVPILRILPGQGSQPGNGVDLIGKTIAHYRILDKLGEGGMGEVFLATDSRLQRNVAIKVIGKRLLQDPHARKWLLREARTASALNHPNICTVHDVGETEVGAYIVMEHLDGRGLHELIPAKGLPAARARAYGIQIADGLVHAHERGVVHRDLKSSNVVITREGRAKILDFGLARRMGTSEADVTRTLESMTDVGKVGGTLAYLPPEVLRGEAADELGDIWAMGVLLHEMVVGALPFTGQTVFEIISGILKDPTPPPPGRVPEYLAAVVLRCLNKDRSARYRQARDVKEALETLERPAPQAGAGVAAGARPGRIRSLAVLPLENLSGDPAEDYFADGMTEAITATMAKIGTLRVISRTSVMQYKGSRKLVPEIARDLNVDAVVEGSILRSGGRVRITAQLIRAASDEHLWAETYDRDLADVLELQSEVSRAIVEEVLGKLSPKERADLAGERRLDPEVYELYLKGRYAWEKRTSGSLRQGIEYYERALERNPTYARAYAGIAECHNVLGFQGATAPRDSFAPAAAAARKALALDPNLAEAHISLAYASLHYDWNWLKVQESFLKGLELGPNYATGHHWYALYLTSMDKRDEAIAAIDRAWELDPLAPIIRTAYGWILYFFREFEASIGHYRKVLDVTADFWAAQHMLGLAYAMDGRLPEAEVQLRAAMRTSKGHAMTMGALGRVLALAGKEEEARGMLEALEASSARKFVPAYEKAQVCAGLGETNEALRFLETAYEERGNWLNYMRVDPVWDRLRGEDRFEAIVQRVFGGTGSG